MTSNEVNNISLYKEAMPMNLLLYIIWAQNDTTTIKLRLLYKTISMGAIVNV